MSPATVTGGAVGPADEAIAAAARLDAVALSRVATPTLEGALVASGGVSARVEGLLRRPPSTSSAPALVGVFLCGGHPLDRAGRGWGLATVHLGAGRGDHGEGAEQAGKQDSCHGTPPGFGGDPHLGVDAGHRINGAKALGVRGLWKNGMLGRCRRARGCENRRQDADTAAVWGRPRPEEDMKEPLRNRSLAAAEGVYPGYPRRLRR